MENNLNQELESAKTEQSKTAVKEGVKGLWISLKTFIIDLLDFRHDTSKCVYQNLKVKSRVISFDVANIEIIFFCTKLFCRTSLN
jgi:hypothetical protein